LTGVSLVFRLLLPTAQHSAATLVVDDNGVWSFLVQFVPGGPDLLLQPQVILGGPRLLDPQFLLADRVLQGALVLGPLPLQPAAGGGRHGPFHQVLLSVPGVLVLVVVSSVPLL